MCCSATDVFVFSFFISLVLFTLPPLVHLCRACLCFLLSVSIIFVFVLLVSNTLFHASLANPRFNLHSFICYVFSSSCVTQPLVIYVFIFLLLSVSPCLCCHAYILWLTFMLSSVHVHILCARLFLSCQSACCYLRVRLASVRSAVSQSVFPPLDY